jgi:hypothetical protein
VVLAIVIARFPPAAYGGAEFQAEGWARRLARRHRVTVITRADGRRPPGRERRTDSTSFASRYRDCPSGERSPTCARPSARSPPSSRSPTSCSASRRSSQGSPARVLGGARDSLRGVGPRRGGVPARGVAVPPLGLAARVERVGGRAGAERDEPGRAAGRAPSATRPPPSRACASGSRWWRTGSSCRF